MILIPLTAHHDPVAITAEPSPMSADENNIPNASFIELNMNTV